MVRICDADYYDAPIYVCVQCLVRKLPFPIISPFHWVRRVNARVRFGRRRRAKILFKQVGAFKEPTATINPAYSYARQCFSRRITR